MLADKIMTPDTIEYYPTHLRYMVEFKEIAKSYDIMLRLVYQALSHQEADQYYLTLTEEGCALQERILKLTPDPDASLEARRQAIIAAQFAQPPYTEKRLREALDALCGVGEYALSVNRQRQTMQLRVRAEKEADRNLLVREARRLCDMWVPLNIGQEVAAFEYYNMRRVCYSAAAVTINQIYNVRLVGG